jgi:Domain of unknown function (DUF1996)
VTVYYRAPGAQKKIKAIPKGLQLLAVDQNYNCNEGPFRDTPPYGCRKPFNTRITFPDCWNKGSLQETTTVMSKNGVCPRSHPYRIPRISYLVQHDNADGRVAKPLRVSAGMNCVEGLALYAQRLLRGEPARLQQKVARRLLEER